MRILILFLLLFVLHDEDFIHLFCTIHVTLDLHIRSNPNNNNNNTKASLAYYSI